MIEILKSIRCIIKSAIILIINLIVYVITIIIPKDKKTIIVGGWFGDRFADNTRYFVLDLVDRKDYKTYFIVSDEKLYNEIKTRVNCVKKKSLKSFVLHLRAKYHVIDQSEKSLLAALSVRATRINLWHGIPIKKIGNLTRIPRKNNFAEKLMVFNEKIDVLFRGYCRIGGWNSYYLLTPSKYDWDVLFSPCFSKLVKPLFAKYPRTDFVLNHKKKSNILLANEKKYLEQIKKEKSNNKKIILYVPTFRDKASTKLLGTENDEEISKYIELLNNNNCVFVIKMHSADKTVLKECKNCIILSNECDISVFLPQADCLITDYSSVYFDYLVLNRPIIFYPYDYNYYSIDDRGLIVEYNSFTPGAKAFDYKEFYDTTKELINRGFLDNYQEERIKLAKKTTDLSLLSVIEIIDKGFNKYIEGEK